MDEDQKINYPEYEKEYSEPKFWEKVANVAKQAGKSLIYNALLLFYVMKESSTPFKYKTMIIGALGYFILPADLVSDFIPVAGYADDAAAIMAVIKIVHDCITPEITAKARAKLGEWF